MSARQPNMEYWHGVYRKEADGIRLIALMRNEQDAKEWHANPGLFFNCRRRVKLNPAPIEVVDQLPTDDVYRAFELLDIIVNDNPYELSGGAIQEARELLLKRRGVVTLKAEAPATGKTRHGSREEAKESALCRDAATEEGKG